MVSTPYSAFLLLSKERIVTNEPIATPPAMTSIKVVLGPASARPVDRELLRSTRWLTSCAAISPSPGLNLNLIGGDTRKSVHHVDCVMSLEMLREPLNLSLGRGASVYSTSFESIGVEFGGA